MAFYQYWWLLHWHNLNINTTKFQTNSNEEINSPTLSLFCWDSDRTYKLLLCPLQSIIESLTVGWTLCIMGRLPEPRSVRWQSAFTINYNQRLKVINRSTLVVKTQLFNPRPRLWVPGQSLENHNCEQISDFSETFGLTNIKSLISLVGRTL